MVEYQQGDRVKIVKGLYRCFKTGTYNKLSGTKIAFVTVDGDTQDERHIRLTSIHPLEANNTNGNNTNNRSRRNNTINIHRAELRQLITDVVTLSDALNEICARLEALDVN